MTSAAPQRLPVCDHHWVAHHQADVMIWIPRCSLCGRYKAAEINEQIAALAARRDEQDVRRTLGICLIHRQPAPPPFDPDPDLVADVERNWFAERAFRKAAQTAHDEAQSGSDTADSIVWTGDNDADVIDFLDRWHLGDTWRGDGYLYLGRRLVHLSPGDTISRRGTGDWHAEVAL